MALAHCSYPLMYYAQSSVSGALHFVEKEEMRSVRQEEEEAAARIHYYDHNTGTGVAHRSALIEVLQYDHSVEEVEDQDQDPAGVVNENQEDQEEEYAADDGRK